jgi:hypothetical protein
MTNGTLLYVIRAENASSLFVDQCQNLFVPGKGREEPFESRLTFICNWKDKILPQLKSHERRSRWDSIFSELYTARSRQSERSK